MIHLLWFGAMAILGFALDLGTKAWIFAQLGMPGKEPPLWLIPHVFGFQTSLNQGALFGMGQGCIPLFVVLSFLALVGVSLMVLFDKEKSIFWSTTLGLIAAGILGNLWDRLALHGLCWSEFEVFTKQCPANWVGEPIHAVRDWILVMIGPYPWPNFNLADSFLVCGSILILLYASFLTSSPKKPQ